MKWLKSPDFCQMLQHDGRSVQIILTKLVCISKHMGMSVILNVSLDVTIINMIFYYYLIEPHNFLKQK